MTPPKFPVVSVAEALSNPSELEVYGLAINFRNDESRKPELRNTAKREKTAFEVRGLEPGARAWIVRETSICHLMRETPGVETEWLGEYPSVEAALRALSNKVSD